MARPRIFLFGIAILICVCLLGFGAIGLLSPIRSLSSVPLTGLQSVVSSISSRVASVIQQIADLQNLQQRNADLERALVNAQGELVELREIKADYQRLIPLLNYKNANPDQTVVAATVIGSEPTGLLRTITIDRGTRDGIAVGMPVITDLGLVGRVYQVSATSASVQLLIDTNSFVNARLQLTRGIGLIQGTPSAGLLMNYIQLTDDVRIGDSVVTSGIGGKFPRGLLIGQVVNKRISDSRLFQEAQVRSLIDFSRLEVVLVITSFTPIDLSSFATPTPVPGAPAQ